MPERPRKAPPPPSEEVATEEDEKEKEEGKLRYWPFKRGKVSRGGPPLERLEPLMSTTSILSVSVSGGDADPKKLWPEYQPLGSWSRKAVPTEWEEKWKSRNKRPHVQWITQGVGEGLPIVVPICGSQRGQIPDGSIGGSREPSRGRDGRSAW